MFETRTRFRAEERERNVRARTGRSAGFYLRAQQSLAGGVSSTIRRGARPYPLFFEKGSGSTVTDVDGNEYVDYGLAWGPLILGHAPSAVAERVAAQARRSLTFGAQHELEFEVAEMVKAAVPCADLVCFASNGTEVCTDGAQAGSGRDGPTEVPEVRGALPRLG